MQPASAGCAETLGFEGYGHARENVAAERVIQLRIGVAVDQSTSGRRVSGNEWRLAVQDVVDAEAELKLLADPIHGRNIKIVPWSEASCSPR